MVKQDGAIFWVHLTTTVAPAADGARRWRVLLTDITARKQLEEIQHFMAKTASSHADESFFQELARYLAQSLGMFYVCIDRLAGDGLNATTLAIWCDSHFEDNTTYALKDTPCGDVVGKTVCCFPAVSANIFRVIRCYKSSVSRVTSA